MLPASDRREHGVERRGEEGLEGGSPATLAIPVPASSAAIAASAAAARR
jgi:hypothetical protein